MGLSCEALGGRSWPSQMHEVTHDFIVVHIKACQQRLGDTSKRVGLHAFIYRPPRTVHKLFLCSL